MKSSRPRFLEGMWPQGNMSKRTKRLNNCGFSAHCEECQNFLECVDWEQFVLKHGFKKRYAHFDRRTSLNDFKTRAKVLNSKWVARHAFWPFIFYKQDLTKYKKGEGRKYKIREIRYCSHIDRCIYQRYSFLLNRSFNNYASSHELDESVIAYRTNSGRSNIDYANQAFDFIERCEQCYVIVSDFSNFFDRIDHEKLKKALCNLLKVDCLPADYYAVFKSLTRYSSWEWDSLLEIAGFAGQHEARKKANDQETIITREAFGSNVKRCANRNDSGFGIPQGSPLSAVLSNVYMIDFDQAMISEVKKSQGLYFRYCDDLLIVLPFDKTNDSQVWKKANELQKLLFCNQYAQINEDKTEVLRFDRRSEKVEVSRFERETGHFQTGGQLDYLGFVYDGERRYLRRRSISKYYRRMYSKVKNVHGNNSYENIYGTYSNLSWKIKGRPSYIDYARRAKHEVGLVDPQLDSLIKHNREKIGKARKNSRNDEGLNSKT